MAAVETADFLKFGDVAELVDARAGRSPSLNVTASTAQAVKEGETRIAGSSPAIPNQPKGER